MRWILLLIGVLIVLGIYVVSQLKHMQFSFKWPRRESRASARRSRHVEPPVDVDIPDVESAAPAALDDFEQMLLDDAATGRPAAPVVEPARKPAPVNPDQVFSLFVLAPPGVPFRGPLVLGALTAAKLEYGDMRIFHRHEVINSHQQRLFSVANIREPGILDPQAMENFTTEGLALFMQVRPGIDAVWAFEAMVAAGRSLADSLDGTVCDATRSVLTRQAIGHMREQVISSQLQQRVAKTAS